MKLIAPHTIVIHHSVTNQKENIDWAVGRINVSHKKKLHKKRNKKGLYVAYHYIIGAKGELRETRDLDEIGYHSGRWNVNMRSIGICLLGNFQLDIPTEEQLIELQNLIKYLKNKFKIKKVCGHRDIKPTACPGKNLTNKLIWYIENGNYNTQYVPDWAKESWKDATQKAIVNGKRPNDIITLQELEYIGSRIKNPRTKEFALSKTGEDMTRARIIKMFYNLKK